MASTGYRSVIVLPVNVYLGYQRHVANTSTRHEDPMEADTIALAIR
jgi:hypothetical protein